MDYIEAKTILTRVKDAPDKLFGSYYNMNLYRGCPHGCIYCDTRSTCYDIGALEHIRVKQDALKILADELPRKRQRGTVTTGSMNDPYMPAEKKLELTRGALRLFGRHGFGVHVITKSTLVTRDIDMLRLVGRTYAAVSVTVTTAGDALAAKIEPHAPPPSERFKAVKALRDAGIYAGITLMPTLPFITDSTDMVSEVVRQAGEAGASYILFWPGMSLREGSREYYFGQLKEHFPEVLNEYRRRFGKEYICNSPNAEELYRAVTSGCAEYGMERSIRIWKPAQATQLQLLQ
ncbi:radical SAM protein [Oleidesulfovibrio sp.]|uniref:SPL family radical SAM protein n=1 Tax=Oleidesulfovibrio sp. TaxID=2909707 RepID=UPI003A880B9D